MKTEPVEKDPLAYYTLGTPIADDLEATAVVEIFRHKNDEKICVAAVVMVQGTVACPVVEEWKFDNAAEKVLLQEIMVEATSRMADFYSALPAPVREALEAKWKKEQ